MQPGTTITPGQGEDQPQQAPEPVVTSQPAPAPTAPIQPQSAPEPQPAAPAPQEQPQAQPPQAPMPAPAAPVDPQTNWQFTSDETMPPQAGPADYRSPTIEPVAWTASEFIDHGKDMSWFLGLGFLTFIVTVVIYLITRDITTCAVIIVVAILFGVTAARKPRTLQFQLDDHGIQIGNKLYPYGSFKSFTVMEEGAFSSIQLLPMQRFMPSISLYYPPEQEGVIVNSLGNFLPHEERHRDPIDNLMRRIKF